MKQKHWSLAANFRLSIGIGLGIIFGGTLVIVSQHCSAQFKRANEFVDRSSYIGQLISVSHPALLKSEIDSILEYELLNPLCPKRAIILADGGRSGNVYFEYIVARILAVLHGRQLYVSRRLAEMLDVYFDGTKALIIDDELQIFCQIESGSLQNVRIAGINQSTIANPLPPGNVILRGVPLDFSSFLWDVLHKSRHVLMKDLEFKPQLMAAVNNHIQDVTRNRSYSTLVGIHVRRTDYIAHLKRLYGKTKDTEADYVRKAKNFYKAKYPNSLFLILSDDVPWCVENLNDEDVVFPGMGNVYDPGWDLAILASCNHTVLTYGTFGMLGAYLAGGEVVMADKATDTPNIINEAIRQLNLPYWHWIDM